MGHSTISFTKPGKLSLTEIDKAFYDRKKQDSQNQDRDSEFHQVDVSPSRHHLHKIYSQSKVREILGSIEYYSCISLYYVSDDVWNKFFSVDEKKIKQIEAKILKLKTKKDEIQSAAWEKSGMKSFVNEQKDTPTTFVSCPKCTSKINSGMLYRANRGSHPRSCPVCSDPDFPLFFRNKIFGKPVVTKVEKLQEEIETLRNELTSIKNKRTSEVSIHLLDTPKYKKLQKEIKTCIAADIHH